MASGPKKLDLVMRQTHRAGEKLFVDYAGQTVPVINPNSGEIREAQIFLAVLGASSYTYAEATVPKITLMLRKAYGGAVSGMCVGNEHGADEILAWPSAEIAALGAEGAVEIFFLEEIKSAPDPERSRQELIEEFRRQITSVYTLAATGRIEKIIDPKETRPALQDHSDKRKSFPGRNTVLSSFKPKGRGDVKNFSRRGNIKFKRIP